MPMARRKYVRQRTEGSRIVDMSEKKTGKRRQTADNALLISSRPTDAKMALLIGIVSRYFAMRRRQPGIVGAEYIVKRLCVARESTWTAIPNM